MADSLRVVRILVYEGDPLWVIDAINKREVQGIRETEGKGKIYEAFLPYAPSGEGSFEGLLEEIAVEAVNGSS